MPKIKEKILIVFNESGSHTMDLISQNEQDATRVKNLAKSADNFIKQVWDNEDDTTCITIYPEIMLMEVHCLSQESDSFPVYLPYKLAYDTLENLFQNPDYVLQIRKEYPLWHLTACLRVALFRILEG